MISGVIWLIGAVAAGRTQFVAAAWVLGVVAGSVTVARAAPAPEVDPLQLDARGVVPAPPFVGHWIETDASAKTHDQFGCGGVDLYLKKKANGAISGEWLEMVGGKCRERNFELSGKVVGPVLVLKQKDGEECKGKIVKNDVLQLSCGELEFNRSKR